MQSINVRAVTPAFMAALFGPALACAVLAVDALAGGGDPLVVAAAGAVPARDDRRHDRRQRAAQRRARAARARRRGRGGRMARLRAPVDGAQPRPRGRGRGGRRAAGGRLIGRHRAPRDRRGLHDRGRRLPEERERVDHLLEVLHVAHVQLQEEAVVARDPVALDDLGRVAGELGDLRELARRRADAQDRRQREPERAGSTAAWKPVIAPASCSRATRSATAGADRPDAPAELGVGQRARPPGAPRGAEGRCRPSAVDSKATELNLLRSPM